MAPCIKRIPKQSETFPLQDLIFFSFSSHSYTPHPFYLDIPMIDNYLFGKILVVLHHINRMDKIISEYGNAQVQTDLDNLIHLFPLISAHPLISVDSLER